MPVSLLLLARTAFESLDELPSGEAVEGRVDLGEVRERVQPRCALVQLARRLRPAQHQHAEHGDLVVGEAERLVEELSILRCPAPGAACKPRPAATCEPLECLVDLAFAVGNDGIPIRRLVAGQAQSVQREGVLIRRRSLFFEQGTEHSQLYGIRVHGRSVRCVPVEIPIRDCYRVADGLLAGEYPGASDPELAARRLRAFSRYGIALFVDLTHPADPLEPYARLLDAGTRRTSHPIPDLGTPTIPLMTRILDEIDAAIAGREQVYVHCWGGIGRTGTVVGCWLARHGLDDGDPIARIARLRRDVSDAFVASPQTDAQCAMVRAWKRGR